MSPRAAATLLTLAALSFACDPATESDAGAVDAGPTGEVDAAPTSCARSAECDDGLFCNGEEECVDAQCRAGTAPCVEGLCDEAADSCDTTCPDEDIDGHPSMACGGDDCDDDDANRYPGNIEVCDGEGHDEDCDSLTYGVRDQDGDGEPDAACCNGTQCGSDCDDTRSGIHPNVPEVCGNPFDDDCDGLMDEGLTQIGYLDPDEDGYADDDAAQASICPGTQGYATLLGDCDESDPGRNPGAVEACDEVDNDCDDMTDEGVDTLYYLDRDGDSYGSDTRTLRACSAPTGYVARGGDCYDSSFPDAARVHPGADYQSTPFCRGEVVLCGTPGNWSCRPNCSSGTSTDPDWDFNCSGAARTENGASGFCFGDEFTCAGSLGSAGFDSPTVAECGLPETYILGCEYAFFNCTEVTETRTLRCR